MQSCSEANNRYHWQFQANGAITGTPALAGNVAYVGAHDGVVYAINVETGELAARSQPLGGKIEGGLAVAVVLGRSSLVVPCSDGRLYLLDAATLAQRSVIAVGGRLRSAPVIQQELVYVGSEDGFVAAISLRGERITGQWRTKGGVRGTPARWGVLLLCGSRDGSLYAFDSRDPDSEPVWAVATRHQVHGTPVVDDKLGLAFFGSLDETVYAVDRSGCTLWPQRLDGQIMAGPTLAEGKLFVGTTDGKLYGLDAASGRLLWQPYQTGDWIVAPPAVWRGVVICGSNDGHLYVLDAATGAMLWRFPAGSAVQAQAAITASALMVVATAAGTVYGLPWHLRNYNDAAKWLEERGNREREAGELWLRAGNQERAFRCLREAGAWLRLAEVAQGAGQYGESARALEQAALGQSGLPDQAAAYYQQAAAAWEADERPVEALRCRKESARLHHAPLLVLAPQPVGEVFLGDHIPLLVSLRNEGVSAACGIVLTVSGHVRVPRRLEVHRPLPPSADQMVTIEDVEPGQSGSAVLTFVADYRDPQGRGQEPARATLRLQVASRPQQVIVGDLVAGDKVVGDKVAGDQIKIQRGEGQATRRIELRSGDEAVKIEGASAGRCCPKCGKAVGEGDNYCPYCRALLQ